jgi:Transglutaminase-like superfamily
MRHSDEQAASNGMTGRLARLFRLSFSDQRLLISAAVALLSAKICVRILRLPLARSAVLRVQRLGIGAREARADRLVWAVDTASRAIPRMNNCLVRAVAAEAMFLRARHPCEIRLGAAKNGREFAAHAWLESGGAVVIGDFELDRYSPFHGADPAKTPSANS